MKERKRGFSNLDKILDKEKQLSEGAMRCMNTLAGCGIFREIVIHLVQEEPERF